jgi:hypothetical protein
MVERLLLATVVGVALLAAAGAGAQSASIDHAGALRLGRQPPPSLFAGVADFGIADGSPNGIAVMLFTDRVLAGTVSGPSISLRCTPIASLRPSRPTMPATPTTR